MHSACRPSSPHLPESPCPRSTSEKEASHGPLGPRSRENQQEKQQTQAPRDQEVIRRRGVASERGPQAPPDAT